MLKQLDAMKFRLEEVLSHWADLEQGLSEELAHAKQVLASMQETLPGSFDLLQIELRKLKVDL